MSPVPIDDPSDPRVADFVGLKNADRAAHEIVVVEGLFAVRRLEGSSFAARAILVTPSHVAGIEPTAAALGVEVMVATQPVIDAVTGFHMHRGVVASADRPAPSDPVAVLEDARVVAVLEEVNDHENLGALFRNAAAFGVDAVLACPRTADPYYRRSIRVSVGHALRVPFARLDPWPSALGRLRERGLRIVALTPDPSATPLSDLDARAPTAIVLGAEGPGLSDEVLGLADDRVRIAMAEGVDSLNVATAGAIAFHHFFQSR